MSEHAPPPPARLPGLIGWLALLPGVLIGFCLGAWMLPIALEWLGEAFLWRNACTSRSELILQATWQWWRNFAGAPVWLVEGLTIVSDTLQQGIAALISSLNGQSGLFWTETVTTVTLRVTVCGQCHPHLSAAPDDFVAGATTVCAHHYHRPYRRADKTRLTAVQRRP